MHAPAASRRPLVAAAALLLLACLPPPLLAQEPAAADHHDHEHKVNVDVYYEALCPDSRAFIVNQLYVTLQNGNLSKYINLTLIPFGKSTAERLSENDYQFTCHHGPEECLGNKLHACALTEIPAGRDADRIGSVSRVQAGFVACLMKMAEKHDNGTVDFKGKECASLNRVNNIISIETCSLHTIGNERLYKFAEKTKALQPPLSTVPTIVFDGKFDLGDNQLAQANFVKALCKHISGEKPMECQGSGASSLNMNASLAALLLSFVLYRLC